MSTLIKKLPALSDARTRRTRRIDDIEERSGAIGPKDESKSVEKTEPWILCFDELEEPDLLLMLPADSIVIDHKYDICGDVPNIERDLEQYVLLEGEEFQPSSLSINTMYVWPQTIELKIGKNDSMNFAVPDLFVANQPIQSMVDLLNNVDDVDRQPPDRDYFSILHDQTGMLLYIRLRHSGTTYPPFSIKRHKWEWRLPKQFWNSLVHLDDWLSDR